MARWYVLQGPHETREGALDAREQVNAPGALRVAKLRDRTGPSVAERLATAEERIMLMGARMAQFEGHPAEGGMGILERLDAREGHLRDHRTRIGDLERLPGASPHAATEPASPLMACPLCDLTSAGVYHASCPRCWTAMDPASTEPTPEQIEAYLRGSDRWVKSAFDVDYWSFPAPDGMRYHVHKSSLADIANAEARSPAEMRARILGASSATEDPDRLAKVAEPMDQDFRRVARELRHSDPTPADYVEAGYNLGREHGRAERDALLARAEKAEAEVKSRDAELDAAEKLLPAEFCCEPALLAIEGIKPLVADWQKRGEEIAALKARRTREEERADVVAMLVDQEVYARKYERASADAYLHARVRISNGEHVGAAKAGITPTPHVPDGETRDPLRDPREGDWFVDHDGSLVNVLHAPTLLPTVISPDGRRTTPGPMTVQDFGAALRNARPMTPAEVEAFKANGTRPTAQPTEAEMAAELRDAGWQYLPMIDRWYPPRVEDQIRPVRTTDAYAAMRAAKGAK